MTLIKSSIPNGSVSKLQEQLTNETKTNEALGRVISLLNDWMSEQKDISSDAQLSHQEICEQVSGLIKSLDKHYSREEKPKDTSVADAIKEIKFPQIPKVDFSPMGVLAQSISQQNKSLQDLVAKISQPTPQIKQDNSGYESLVRESLAAINKSNEAMRYLGDCMKKMPDMKEEKEDKKPTSYIHKVEYDNFGQIKEIKSNPINNG